METFHFKGLRSYDSIDYAAKLKEYQDFSGEITFYFPSQVTYEPFGMLMTSTAIRQFAKDNPNAKKCVHISKQGDACKYAGHMGFFKAISETIPYGKRPGEANGSERYIPITPINLKTIRQRALREGVAIQQQIQTTAQNISRRISLGSKPLEQTLTYVLREIIRNSEEHSNADTVWLCAQHWPYYNLVEIGMLDEGIGIKKSLKTNKYYASSIKTDEDALKLSLLPGVTEAYKRSIYDDGMWANSGYGLYIAKEICTHMGSGGMFLLASGESCIGIGSKNYSFHEINEKTFINGTAICIRFKTDSVDSFEDVRSRIILDGQSEAAKVKRAIKKASYSSGGLIELLK